MPAIPRNRLRRFHGPNGVKHAPQVPGFQPNMLVDGGWVLAEEEWVDVAKGKVEPTYVWQHDAFWPDTND